MAIFTAIGTAVAGALFAGSTFAASVISGALAIGANFLVSSLRKQKQPNREPTTAVSGQTQYGASVTAGVMFGTGMIAGHSVNYWKYGAGNKFNAEQFVLSNGWCDGLDPTLIFDGKVHDLVAQTPTHNEIERWTVSDYGTLIEIRFFDGRPGQQADGALLAATAGLDNALQATDRGDGLCYVSVILTYSDKFEGRYPEFQFILRGLREYDPRKDSTVSGGSGLHRLSDSSTWEHTTNPAVHRMNYQLGLRGLSSERSIVGMGKTLGSLDLASYIAAMNVCDTPRQAGGGTIATYSASIYVSADGEHTTVLTDLDDAMAGYAMNRGGLAGVLAGAPQVQALNLTSDDVRIDEGKTIAYRRSVYDSINVLSGQFTSPDSLWQAESLDTVSVNADVAADGGRKRDGRNDFLQVTNASTAQYLLNIRYRQGRRGGSATVPVSSRVGFKVDVGDWITYEGLTWLVFGRKFDGAMRCTLELRETSADIYDEDGISAGPVVPVYQPPINPSVLTTVQDFAVQVGSTQGAGNAQSPSLRFLWTPPDDPTITDVVIKYWSTANPSQVFTAVQPDVESGEFQTTANVEPGQIYVAKATIVTTPDRFKTFTSDVSTAAATPSRTLQVDLGNIANELREPLEVSFARIESLQDKLAQLAHDVAQENIDVRTTSFTLDSRMAGAYASIRREQAVRTSETSALAQEIATLAASVGEDVATAIQALQTEVDTIDGEVTAVASSLLSVEVKADNATAQGLFQVEAVSTPAGVTARMALRLRENTSGAFVDAGIFLDLVPDGQGGLTSRIVQKADQLVFVNDTGDEEFPMVFENGVLRLNVADIGTVNTGVIDLQNGYIIS